MNIQFIEELSAAIPDAKFIHIYRDGRDVAQSNHRRWNKNPQWSMYRWAHVVQAGRQAGEGLDSDRYLELGYEAFTSEPELDHRNCSVPKY